MSKELSINKDIQTLDNMCNNDKCQTFLNIVSSDGKHIEFWKFFDYMKNRTNDIKNINFD